MGLFAKKYRESANEHFNQTTNFAEFPKHLFAYITAPINASSQPAEARAKAKIQYRINKINTQSVKTQWRDYLAMTLPEKEAYFT